MPDWSALPAEQRRLFARMMETFAGFLAHTDAQIGRLLATLEANGRLDDTLVLLLSDNGASAEGGPIGSFNEHRFVHDKVDDIQDTLARLDDLRIGSMRWRFDITRGLGRAGGPAAERPAGEAKFQHPEAPLADGELTPVAGD